MSSEQISDTDMALCGEVEELTTQLQVAMQEVWDTWPKQWPPECFTIKEGNFVVDFTKSSFIRRVVIRLLTDQQENFKIG